MKTNLRRYAFSTPLYSNNTVVYQAYQHRTNHNTVELSYKLSNIGIYDTYLATTYFDSMTVK